ncbi:TlpA family protein disulfide reductase [Nitratifractor salsuginis]|uniref:Lipoprotein thioredoxin n=1 Tax=Nitratifractor salsuginis (strain DSM 16511 / JCM 12458 / E9I37-1) TaxID=749222 RepID=E6WZZ7_NITSE|nr:redoxin domain-containing protein [Nitratifractor salsuginis]ADV45655.1 lipoprotein thioredoxin [Nitratifractor salsuginis DSM 16511]
MQKRWIAAVLFIGLLFSGCGEKKSQSSTQKPGAEAPSPISPPAPLTPKIQSRFRIRDIEGRETSLEFSGNAARFSRISQPIVILNLFSPECSPCRGMLPALGTLQQKNRKDLFVIGILLGQTPDPKELQKFMQRYSTDFFLSLHPDNATLARYLQKELGLGETLPLPLTVLYKKGKYVMKIRGAVPYEMLQTLVDQLKDDPQKKE